MLTQPLSENWRDWPLPAKVRYLERLQQTPSLAQTTPKPPDIAAWIDACVTIEDPQLEPSIILFHPWPAQRDLLAELQSNRQLIILKARQLGITWIVIVYVLWLCIFHANKTIIVISKDQDAAAEVIRRAKGVFNRLRDKPVLLTVDNVGEAAWSNGSRIKAFASTSDAGSSYTGSMVILDELAKNRNAEDIYTAVKPTIDDGGAVVLLSTARGQDNLFHRLWTKAREGANNLKPLFIPWTARPGRDNAWYVRVAADAVSMAHHMQEYPATPEEAFQSLAELPFLPSMSWWDACQEGLPPLTRNEPMVIALDAAVSGDSFGLVAVTRHPARPGDVAIRHVQEWKPPTRGTIRYRGAPDAPWEVTHALIASWNVVQVCGDPYQLHQFFTDLRDEGSVFVSEFNQGPERLEADKMWLDVITHRRVAHPGDPALRRHIDNSDRKVDETGHRLRIVKREEQLKIDLNVCASMATYRCLKLSL